MACTLSKAISGEIFHKCADRHQEAQLCHNKVNKSGYLPLPFFIKARACYLSSLCEKPLVIKRRKRNCHTHTHNQRYGESKFALHENPLVFFWHRKKIPYAHRVTVRTSSRWDVCYTCAAPLGYRMSNLL
jgi:hypothetical protein